MLIEFFGTTAEAEAMAAKVGAVEGVDVQTMVFGH